MTLKCSHCLEDKDINLFSKKSDSKRGYSYLCKKCHNIYNREKWYIKNSNKQKISSANWSRNNKDQVKASKYNVTKEYINNIRLKQNNKCAICQKEDFIENIDHCHINGNVRGILCPICNKGLGFFKDNITYLNNAINYLNDNKI